MKVFFKSISLLVCTILTLELTARLDDYYVHDAPLLENYNYETLFEFDEKGKKGKAYARYLKWQLNSYGLRGPEIDRLNPNIVVVGSSETFGLYESKDQEWPRQLENKLKEKGNFNNVINFALPGMLLSTFEKRLESMCQIFSPEMVILYPSPLGYLYRDIKDPDNLNISFDRYIQPVFEFRILSKIREVVKKNIPKSFKRTLDKWSIERSIDQNSNIYDKIPVDYINVFKGDLQRVINKLQAKNISIVLISHATYFGQNAEVKNEDLLINWRKFYPNLKEDGILDMEKSFNIAIREVAEENKLKFIDLAFHLPPGDDYFADFVHFTDKGASEVARIVSEEIVTSKFIP